MRTYFIDIIKNKKVFIFGQPCTYQGDHLGKGTPSVPCYLIFKISEIKMACFLLERDLWPPPPLLPLDVKNVIILKFKILGALQR